MTVNPYKTYTDEVTAGQLDRWVLIRTPSCKLYIGRQDGSIVEDSDWIQLSVTLEVFDDVKINATTPTDPSAPPTPGTFIWTRSWHTLFGNNLTYPARTAFKFEMILFLQDLDPTDKKRFTEFILNGLRCGQSSHERFLALSAHESKIPS